MRPIPDQDSTTSRRRSVTTSNPKWSWGLRAVALASLLCAGQAHALSLGKVSILSVLGEPLVAEIDIPQISAEEEASLKVEVGSADVFKVAGVDLNPALIGAELKLRRRPNGRMFLRLQSHRPITEPFVDLILEAHWASGRIIRDYTLLLDPPNTRSDLPPPLSASVTEPPSAPPPPLPTEKSAPPPAPIAIPITEPPPSQIAAQESVASPSADPISTKKSPPAPAPTASPSKSDVAGSGTVVTIKAGDTATKLAANHKPAGASLDQMLVAMLRANPQAFVKGNIHRLRAGAVLEIPSEATVEATSVSAKEARGVLATQSRDFNEFRRRLAVMPTAAPATPTNKAVGKIKDEVKVKSTNTTSPDKLTLSKPQVKTGKVVATKEDDIAKALQSKETIGRKEELAKNIADLTQIATTASVPKIQPAPAVPAPPPPASSPTTPATTTALTPPPAPQPPAVVPAPAAPEPQPPLASTGNTPPATTTTPPADLAANPANPANPVNPPPPTETPPPADGSTTPATDPNAQTPPPPVPTPPAAEPPQKPLPPPPPPLPPVEEPSFFDSLTEEWWVLPAGGLLLAGLLGGAALFIRSRQKARGTGGTDSSFLESRMQPDSFFGSSGGQNVDTAESGSPAASSMMYSPSQLDVGGDVDPVAEADVYLAYGRDLQAEEILKEALRTDPHRVAIHCKLLDIYAKRKDTKAFEVLAYEVYSLTQGKGLEWDVVCELGRDLSPDNALFRPGGTPKTGMAGLTMQETRPHDLSELDSKPQALADLDLDLDFSDESLPEPVTTRNSPPPPSPRAAMPEPPEKPAFTRTKADSKLPQFPDHDEDFPRPPFLPSMPPGEKLTAHRVSEIAPFTPPPPSQPMPLTSLSTPPAQPSLSSLTNKMASLAAFSSQTAPPVSKAAPSQPASLAGNAGPLEPVSTSAPLEFHVSGLDFSLGQQTPPPPPPTKKAAPTAPPSSRMDFEMLDFDMEALPSPTAPAPTPAPASMRAPTLVSSPSPMVAPPPTSRPPIIGAPTGPADLYEMEMIGAEVVNQDDADPLETKLSLAAEFLTIGDTDAARSLAEEVFDEATGALKKKASKFLSDMA